MGNQNKINILLMKIKNKILNENWVFGSKLKKGVPFALSNFIHYYNLCSTTQATLTFYRHSSR
jgi:hypothetical protein